MPPGLGHPKMWDGAGSWGSLEQEEPPAALLPALHAAHEGLSHGHGSSQTCSTDTGRNGGFSSATGLGPGHPPRAGGRAGAGEQAARWTDTLVGAPGAHGSQTRQRHHRDRPAAPAVTAPFLSTPASSWLSPCCQRP